jgi:hypothetical protein
MSFPKVPPIILNANEMARRLAVTANQNAGGKMNVTGTITLTANVGSTTITLSEDVLTSTSHVNFTPTTANAASEQGNGTMYSSIIPANPHAAVPVPNASIVITHANNAQTDRTFTYAILG